MNEELSKDEVKWIINILRMFAIIDIKEMQIKTTLNLLLTLVRMVIIKRKWQVLMMM